MVAISSNETNNQPRCPAGHGAPAVPHPADGAAKGVCPHRQQQAAPAVAAARLADQSETSSVHSESTAAATIASWSKNWQGAVTTLSPEALAAKAASLAQRTQEVQLKYFSVDPDAKPMVLNDPAKIPYVVDLARRGDKDVKPWVKRGEHAKPIIATEAEARVASNLPPELEAGPFKRGARISALVRLSHGPGDAHIADKSPGHPGFTLRLQAGDRVHDMIFSTGSSGFFAKDADAAVVALEAQANRAVAANRWGKILGKAAGNAAALKTLVEGLTKLRGSRIEGLKEALRFAHDGTSAEQHGKSLAQTTYFGKLPFQLGEHAVKFRIVPAEPGSSTLLARPEDAGDSGYFELSNDMIERQRRGAVRFKLQVQGLPQGGEAANLADARSVWDSPFITIAEITLPQKDQDWFQVHNFTNQQNGLAFSPANRWDDSDDRCLKPLGTIGALRSAIYKASANLRGGVCPFGHT